MTSTGSEWPLVSVWCTPLGFILTLHMNPLSFSPWGVFPISSSHKSWCLRQWNESLTPKMHLLCLCLEFLILIFSIFRLRVQAHDLPQWTAVAYLPLGLCFMNPILIYSSHHLFTLVVITSRKWSLFTVDNFSSTLFQITQPFSHFFKCSNIM